MRPQKPKKSLTVKDKMKEFNATGELVEYAINEDETITVTIPVKGSCAVGSGPQKEFRGSVLLTLPRGALRDVTFESKANVTLLISKKD